MEQVKEIDINEKMKTEALSRMRSLRLMKQVMDEFDESGTLYYSERINRVFDGILYYVNNNPEYAEAVEHVREMGMLPYHAQLTNTTFGRLFTVLYVSNCEDEWEYDRNDIKEGYAMAYVANLDDPTCSEFGTVAIAPKNGGITRLL